MAAPNSFSDLGLSIIGVDAEYPPYSLDYKAIETLAHKYYPDTPAMNKVLSINRYTGIDYRASIGEPDHPAVNRENAPSITELHELFMSDGLPLAVTAARRAIEEAKIDLEDITHIVTTTCTDSANPGFDHFLARDLGIKHQVEKVLLHGVGCSGGLATLRTAANLALGHTARGKPARVLCVALEVSTTMVRSELDSINENQETRIGVCLFSDCGSAVVLSNGIGGARPPVYQLLGWDHRVLPDTHDDLGFDANASGWKVVLTPRVPKLTGGAVSPAFEDLKAAIPELPPTYQNASDFDWAMHPGGATILSGAERSLGITPQHMRASYDTYVNHGNSSSASIFRVMHRMRSKDMDALAPDGRVRDYVVACAFGPGITVETCMLKRGRSGTSEIPTPPDTDHELVNDTEENGPVAQAAGGNAVNQDVGASDNTRRFIEDQLERIDLD